MVNNNVNASILLALLVLSFPAAAQKLYKIVDDEGNVTFSQFPPPEKPEKATIDEHTVFGGSQSTVVDRGDYMYCGDIRLANKTASRERKSRYVQNLESQRTDWMRRRDRLTKRIDETNQAVRVRREMEAAFGVPNA